MQKAELDSGTIIYILIAVVAAITSIIQKKKKPSVTGPETENPPKRSWEEVLTDTFDIPENKPTPAPRPVQRPVQPTSKKQHNIENPFVSSKFHKEKIADEGIAATIEEFDIRAGEIGSSTENMPRPKVDFDLRRAVIYSEVLNRKY